MSGLDNELSVSRTFHEEGIPLLVSPRLLRARFLGQIDLARLRKDRQGWITEVGEVKSSTVGEEQFVRYQKVRLVNALNFLGALFGHRCKLVLLTNEESK